MRGRRKKAKTQLIHTLFNTDRPIIQDRASNHIRLCSGKVNLEEGTAQIGPLTIRKILHESFGIPMVRLYLKSRFIGSGQYSKYHKHMLIEGERYRSGSGIDVEQIKKYFAPEILNKIMILEKSGVIPDFIAIHCNGYPESRDFLYYTCPASHKCCEFQTHRTRDGRTVIRRTPKNCRGFFLELYDAKIALEDEKLHSIVSNELTPNQRKLRETAIKMKIPLFMIKVGVSDFLSGKFKVVPFILTVDGWNKCN